MRPLDIAIVGYGTAGQALAVLLARDGHRLQVFEQAEAPRPVGAGFLLQPTGLGALWQMGLLEAVMAHGRRIDRLFGDTPRGDNHRAVMDMRYVGLDARLFGWGLQRGALFEALRAALFVPMGRMPGGRGPMLRVLTGAQRGWLGRHALPEGLLEVLGRSAYTDQPSRQR